MLSHLIVPGVTLEPGYVHRDFEDYLREWREAVVNAADDGVAAASECLQAILVDMVLDGRCRYDWISVMDDLLTESTRPIAYSLEYGKKLYSFDRQYCQSTIHAVHTRWWIEKLLVPDRQDCDRAAALILEKKQSDGLIYDKDISVTVLRHRMKAELAMSAAMGAEILSESGHLTDSLRDELAASLCDPRKLPLLGYMTTEQFRLSALKFLDREEQFPVGIDQKIEACAEGLGFGWGDFAMKSKREAYMGTAQRTSRDTPIHSPLVACHVAVLIGEVEDCATQGAFKERLKSYARMLSGNPKDIPAFQMRDVTIPFGSDITPIEAICASHLIFELNSGRLT